MFIYNEHVGILNEQGDVLAAHVQRLLVRAGMKDISVIAVDPREGRRMVLRHGPSLYRIHARDEQHPPAAAEAGWIPLIIADTMDPAVTSERKGAGTNFLDVRGNAQLFLDQNLAAFGRSGQQPPRTRTQGNGAKAPATAGQPAQLVLKHVSHQVTFALLCEPQLAACTVREIADAAGTGLGTAHLALQKLQRAGYLLDGHLYRMAELLTIWVNSYAQFQPKTFDAGTYYINDPDWVGHLVSIRSENVLASGAAAAARVTNLLATDGIIYTDQVFQAASTLDLTRKPTALQVTIRQRFWGPSLPIAVPGLAPSVLIYGDLLQDGDERLREAAEELRMTDAHLRALDRR